MIFPTNNINNTNFRAVYYGGSSSDFNSKQKSIARKIYNKLYSIAENDTKGRTYSDIFKKKGYDYLLQPDFNNSVRLSATKKLKRHGSGLDAYYTSSKKSEFTIGRYNEKYPFHVDDLYTRHKEISSSKGCVMPPFIVGVLAFLAIIGTELHNRAFDRSYESYREKYRKTAIDTVKKVSQDTVKVIK